MSSITVARPAPRARRRRLGRRAGQRRRRTGRPGVTKSRWWLARASRCSPTGQNVPQCTGTAHRAPTRRDRLGAVLGVACGRRPASGPSRRSGPARGRPGRRRPCRRAARCRPGTSRTGRPPSTRKPSGGPGSRDSGCRPAVVAGRRAPRRVRRAISTTSPGSTGRDVAAPAARAAARRRAAPRSGRRAANRASDGRCSGRGAGARPARGRPRSRRRRGGGVAAQVEEPVGEQRVDATRAAPISTVAEAWPHQVTASRVMGCHGVGPAGGSRLAQAQLLEPADRARGAA